MSSTGTLNSSGMVAGPRILVVRLGSMGDVLHTLPAVATLKHSFPGSSITWVVDPHWAPLLEGNPFVDRVILFSRKTVRGVTEAWRQLRGQRFDFAADFQGLIQSAILASSARADKIIGFHQSLARERLAVLAYSTRVKSSASHVVDRNLELAKACGANSIISTFPLPPGEAEGVLPEGDFVLASPLAGWAGKQWPLEYYTELARRLQREFGIPLVLNGSPHAGRVQQVPGTLEHVSGIPGLIHATRRAVAVIGVDSGPTHLAAALGKPGVAIYGPTSPERNGPYGGSLTVLRNPGAITSYKRRPVIEESMKDITPDAVFEALKTQSAFRARSAGCTA